MTWCSYSHCSKLAIFGWEIDMPQYCFGHRNVGMSKVIWFCDCGKDAFYGNKKFEPTHCGTCKMEGMWRVLQNFCKALNCDNAAKYGLPDKKPIVCINHMRKGMVNRIRPQCQLCMSVGINKKYTPYCAGCFFFIHPNDPRKRYFKTKEKAFLQPIRERYPNMVIDQIIDGGTSKRRPDGLIKLDGFSVIIEVDEGQHLAYETICENKRMMELFVDLGSKPVVFIRINPDGYRDSQGKRIASVFKGKVINKGMLKQRMEVLIETVETVMANKPTKEIQVIELFYNKG